MLYDDIDDYQYDFKQEHSTTMYRPINILIAVVNYYVSHSSHVFTCFIDFSKAFDKFNYLKLLMNFLDGGVDASKMSFLSF